MIISDGTLIAMLANREIVVEPLTGESIQPASIDCRLGSNFLMLDDSSMEILKLDSEIKYREIEGDSIVLPPHAFCLATTMENIEIPDDVVCFVEGRSSIGRMGLFIQNAGWVDPGWKGRITLELYNANSLPIKLEAGRRICQMVFAKMDKEARSPYRGKYQGQTKTEGSQIFKDSEARNFVQKHK